MGTENSGVKSVILNEIIKSLPKLKEPVKELLDTVNLKQAAEGNKETMWNDPDTYPEIIDADMVRISQYFIPLSLLLNCSKGYEYD